MLGYGYHGDFISAWDEGVLQQAVEQCTDMGGQMRSCGVFEFPENTASCTLENLPEELKDEKPEGPMPGLPGGCEVQSGPEPAKKGKGATGSSSGGKSGGKSGGNAAGNSAGKSDGSSSLAGDSSSYSPPAAAPSSPHVENKKAGAVFAQVKDTGDEYQAPANKAPADQAPVDQAPAAPTTTPPPSGPTNDQAGKVVSTKIWTEGRVVHEEKIVMQEVTVTSGGAKVKRTAEAKAEHVKRHGHRHHHPMQHGAGGRRMR